MSGRVVLFDEEEEEHGDDYEEERNAHLEERAREEDEALAMQASMEAEADLEHQLMQEAEAKPEPKKVVLVFWTNRSEEGILAPVVRRLERDPEIACVPVLPERLRGTDPEELGATYRWAYARIGFFKTDLVVAPFDRPEMLMVAVAAMTRGVPVCQLHAGDLSGPGTYDDKTRNAITMIADLVLCNGEESFQRATMSSLTARGIHVYVQESDRSVHVNDTRIVDVGSTAVDDIEPDYRLLPDLGKVSLVDEVTTIHFLPTPDGRAYSPFDLVLYNPETATEKDHENLSEIELELDDEKPTVFIGPNGDTGSDEIEFVMKKWCEGNALWRYYPSVPRAQFLGLMQKAKHLIGNSSSFCVEAPLLREDWETAVHLVGTRNTSSRFLRDSRPGASDRIHREIRRFLGLKEASDG